jgi:hypothetical protein
MTGKRGISPFECAYCIISHAWQMNCIVTMRFLCCREAAAMDTFVATIMDEFFTLANEVLALDHDTRLVDRLTAATGYSQLLQIEPANMDYLRKFQRATNELRFVLRQKRALLMGNPRAFPGRLPS